jgi:hypothetical protein
MPDRARQLTLHLFPVLDHRNFECTLIRILTKVARIRKVRGRVGWIWNGAIVCHTRREISAIDSTGPPRRAQCSPDVTYPSA